MRALTQAAILFVCVMMSGCLIVSGGEGEEHEEFDDEECWTECHDYSGCETVCDDYGCWDECYDEVTCETVCESESVHTTNTDYFDEPSYCYSDLECAEGRICVSGVCEPADTDQRGSAGLCQACESRSDCVEEDALCLGFLADEDSGPVETVCGRACEEGNCPQGFVCISVGEAADPDQCVPEREEDEVRSCSAGGSLECVVAADCDGAEQCVDNTCQAPTGAECTDDTDCDDGEVCDAYQCVDDADSSQCVTPDECADHQTCVDGECVRDLESCVFNADCASDYRCVDGQCTPTCDTDADCGTSERCRENICEYIECYQTSDCSPGNICVDASCETACDETADCSDGFICDDLGYCAPDPDVECRSSAECAPEQECSPQGTCEAACTCNSDCADGEICSTDTGICQEPETDSDEGVDC